VLIKNFARFSNPFLVPKSVLRFDSVQYRHYRKQESQVSLVIDKVENQIEKENTGSEAQDYRKRQRELEEELESARRKVRR
jgi:hypothetical protein